MIQNKAHREHERASKTPKLLSSSSVPWMPAVKGLRALRSWCALCGHNLLHSGPPPPPPPIWKSQIRSSIEYHFLKEKLSFLSVSCTNLAESFEWLTHVFCDSNHCLMPGEGRRWAYVPECVSHKWSCFSPIEPYPWVEFPYLNRKSYKCITFCFYFLRRKLYKWVLIQCVPEKKETH